MTGNAAKRRKAQTVTVPVASVTVGSVLSEAFSPVNSITECATDSSRVHFGFAQGWSWCIPAAGTVAVPDA